MEVVMRIFGIGGESVVLNKVGNFAARASGVRERFVDVVEGAGEVARSCWEEGFVLVRSGGLLKVASAAASGGSSAVSEMSLVSSSMLSTSSSSSFSE